MEYRHELKHEISYGDMLVLRSRLGALMAHDEHTPGGIYTIRSVYFDNLYDKALREKIDGVNRREKFRIRWYNGDTRFIRIEKKGKINGLCAKVSAKITLAEAEKLFSGDIGWMKTDSRPLLPELYSKMYSEGLRPMTIVDYTREAFIYAPGNVRVTLDYNIRTGLKTADFLNPKAVTVPAGDQVCILEVKWDEYLPAIIRDAVILPARRTASFSKYAICRTYG